MTSPRPVPRELRDARPRLTTIDGDAAFIVDVLVGGERVATYRMVKE